MHATDVPDAPNWAVRLEAKVDIVIASHGADISDLKAASTDHEQRLRWLRDKFAELESRPHVSPRVLWSVVASAAGLLISAIAVYLQLK